MPRKWNLNGRVMSALRQLSRFDPARTEALRRARVAPNQYRCKTCKDLFPRVSIELDHVEPVKRLTGFNGDWNDVIKRLFPGHEGYQVLCIPCHRDKTILENAERQAA